MNIDFKKFKKIECDDKSTTLQHPSGHLIKIAHKGLKPEHKKELDALPENYAKGGKITYKEFMAKNPSMPSKPAASSNTMPGSPTEAKNAYTEPDAMGTSIPKSFLKEEMTEGNPPDVVVEALNKKAPPYGPLGADPKYHSPPCINSSCKSYGKSHPNCRCYGGKMGMYGGYADGGEVEHFCDSDRKHFKGCEYFAEGGISGKKWLGQDSSEPQQFNMTAPENIQSSPDQQAPQQQAPMSVDVNPSDVNPAPEGQSAQPAQETPATPDENMQDATDTPQAQSQAQAPVTKVQQFQQHKDNNAQELFPEAQAFKADLDNGHIQPKTYQDLFAQKSTLGKIGTIFGLLLSGGGSAVSGQPNALLSMMNQTIDNDLKAQEESQANKQNYLKINQGNILNKAQSANLTADANTKAYALSKVQMNYAALHHLVDQTSKLPPGPQRDQAMNQLAMLNQTVQNENYNILDRASTGAAFYKTMFGDQSNGAPTAAMKSGVFGDQAKELGTDIENKTIPGVPGRANRPIQQNDREQITAMNVLDNKAKDILNFAKQHKGSVDPKVLAQGAQKSAELVNFYNQSIGAGILTPGRLAWLDSQVGKNPTSIFQDVLGNNAKLNEIKNSNASRRDTLLQSYGYKTQAPESQTSPKVQSKSGQHIVYKNGKAFYK